MSGPERKRRSRRSRLPILPPPLPEHLAGRGAVGMRPGAGSEDSIYTLRGYKAWAARVKAAWDAES
jgi:hypothetical protein